MTNWIAKPQDEQDKHISLESKIKQLLALGDKLVLCQIHELERLKLSSAKDRNKGYIENLYNHYVVKQLPKTYLMQ